MKKRFLKNALGLAISAALIVSVPVYAEEVLYFHNFADYEGGVPDGFSKAYNSKDAGGNPVPTPVTVDMSSQYNENAGGYYVKDTSSAKGITAVPGFGRIIDSSNTGILHVSCDFKNENTGNGNRQLFFTFINITDSSTNNDYGNWGLYFSNEQYKDSLPADLWNCFSAEENLTHGHLGRIRIRQTGERHAWFHPAAQLYGGVPRYEYHNVEDGTYFKEMGWNKIDIYLDMSTKYADVYLNGKYIDETNASAINGDGTSEIGLSATTSRELIAFVLGRDGASTYSYDNMYAAIYPLNETDTVKIAADQIRDGESKKIVLSFSEWLSQAPTKEDFEIVNAYTGEAVEFNLVSSNAMNVVLELPNEDVASKYNVYFSDSSDLSGSGSAKLSSEPAAAYINVMEDSNLKPILNNLEVVDYDGNILDLSAPVTTAMTGFKVNFTAPVEADNIDDYIYIADTTGTDTESTECSVSDDGKSVDVKLTNLLSAGTAYKIVISNELTRDNASSTKIARTYEYSFTTASDAALGWFGESLTEVAGEKQAKVKIIKTSSDNVNNTVVLCAYKNVTDENGNVYEKLVDVDVDSYNLTGEEKRIVEKTLSVDKGEATHFKCYINDLTTQKNLFEF